MDENCVDSIASSMQQMNIRKRSSLCQRRSSFDRFIPNRRGSDFETAYHRLTSLDTSQNDSVSSGAGSSDGTPWGPPSGKRHSTSSNTTTDDRILVFSPRTPIHSHADNLQDLDDCSTPRSFSPRRYLPKSPERILDMPEIRDDFYCNILDWSCRNNIAVAIGDKVYSWNVENSGCQPIPVGNEEEDGLPAATVKSLSWDHMGRRIAVGTTEGDIRVWNKDKKELTHFPVTSAGKPAGHTNGVVWDRTGNIMFGIHNCGLLSQVDMKNMEIQTHQLHLHQQGAAGLRLCEDNKHLAIGVNDGSIHVWNTQEQKVTCHIDAHSTATKALAWVPWKKHVLISGGGTGDGAIKMWNTKTGDLLDEVQTNSQVCSLVISGLHRELITGHGISHNDIIIWSLPSIQMVGRLKYHSARVLHLALNAREDMLASVSADESLMMWKCFEGISRRTGRRTSCPTPCISPLSFSLR